MSRESIALPCLFAKRELTWDQRNSTLDEEGFGAFYRATAPALQRYIRRTCGNAALAEDLLQESFFRFLRTQLPEMDARRMKAYLFKIATSLVVDHWRRAKRERFWNSLWHPSSTEPVSQREDVSRALSKLKPVERALLWLAYVEGFDHSEIASTLGLNEKSIRVLLFRARKKLAGILGRHSGPHGEVL
jgi:RNA polymerase sigma-70 factor (ECF subfamily)